MKRFFTTALALGVLAAAPLTAAAQEAGDPPTRTDLRALVTDAGTDDARTTVQDFLKRADVRAVAADRGIDVERLEGAVATADAGSLATIAERIDDAQDQLAGGQTVTITATTIIIILLVIILIIVA